MSLPDDAVPIHNEGFLRLVEVMGDDHAVVRAARVSYTINFAPFLVIAFLISKAIIG